VKHQHPRLPSLYDFTCPQLLELKWRVLITAHIQESKRPRNYLYLLSSLSFLLIYFVTNLIWEKLDLAKGEIREGKIESNSAVDRGRIFCNKLNMRKSYKSRSISIKKRNQRWKKSKGAVTVTVSAPVDIDRWRIKTKNNQQLKLKRWKMKMMMMIV